MCRFVAIIAEKDIEMGEYLDFLKIQARSGKRAPHPDGFGLWLKNRNGEYLYKSTNPIWKTDIILPKAHVALFHARKRGKRGAPISILNLHPFIYNDSVFMHNGILTMNRHPKAMGETDTESFFLTLVDMGLINGIKYIVKKYNFKSLNFVMFKENKLYTFRFEKELKNYFTIYVRRDENKVIISTEKNGNNWEEIKNGELARITPDLHLEKSCIFQDMCH